MTSDNPAKKLPYSHKGDLTTKPVKGHLIRLTIPMIWGLLAVISVQLVDTYFVGMLGTEELAAISFTFPVTMLISHLLFGMNIATSSVVARLIGEKKTEDMKRIVLHAISMNFIASIITAIVCYLLLDQIFGLLGAQGRALSLIREYMPLWLIASAVLAVPVNSNSAIRAAGDSKTPALVMTGIALINLIMDPILIFGYFGAPEMGVKGAATATLIAYSAGFVMLAYILPFRKKLVATDGLHLDKLKDSLRRLLVIAIPAGITNTINPLTSAFIVSLLAAYGTESVAAYGIATRVEAFAFLIVISLALGMSPIIGQNWGAKLYKRVHETINLAIGFNFIWSFLVTIVLAIFGETIAAAFTDDETVIEITKTFFWIVPFSYAFANLIFGWSSAFNAMGMPKRAFVMIVVKSLILMIPAVYIGANMGQTTGIFIAMACVNTLAGIAFHIISWRACLSCEN